LRPISQRRKALPSPLREAELFQHLSDDTGFSPARARRIPPALVGLDGLVGIRSHAAELQPLPDSRREAASIMKIQIESRTYDSETLPENLPEACYAVFEARREGTIPNLKLLHAWHSLDTSTRANNGSARWTSVENWAFNAFATAAFMRDLVTFRLLVAEGVAPLARSVPDNTPLLHAIVASSWRWGLRRVLESGANPDEVDARSRTAFHRAALQRDLAAMNILLRYGALVDSRDCDRWTPLHCVASREPLGGVQIAERLLGKGADPHARTILGETALDLAQSHGNGELANYLAKQMAATWTRTTAVHSRSSR
jgi:hypothetical protein